jgi:hypothetical protein
MAYSFIINSDFLISHGFSLHTPYAAIMAPRSRRDKDMSDNNANKQIIKVFRRRNSPSHPAKTVTVTTS